MGVAHGPVLTLRFLCGKQFLLCGKRFLWTLSRSTFVVSLASFSLQVTYCKEDCFFMDEFYNPPGSANGRYYSKG